MISDFTCVPTQISRCINSRQPGQGHGRECSLFKSTCGA